MSMYKNIFVNENDDATVSVQIQGIDGTVKSFGETAFASVAEAIAEVSASNSNAVIKVTSGKYDSYYVVVNEGEAVAPTSVVAVDFDGGSVVTDSGEITVADTGFSAETQLSIIDELNANNAVNGTIYVADSDAATSTLVVGVGEANYVVGQSADVVYGADAEEIYTILNNMNNIDMLATTEVGSGQNVYFSSTNSSQTYVFKAGSVAHNELSKWDMTGAVTIEGGAKLVAGRNNAAAIAANTPQTAHIKSTLTLAGTADNKAVLNFLSDTRQDASLGILYNGKLVATHAEISVADLGFTGTASMSDCTVYVDGVVAFGKNTFYKQTMTNTTMNVRGHNRHNENKYFSTEGVILNNLTMTNSSINVDNGVDGAPEKVTIKKLTMNDSKVITEGALEITGTLTIDSDSLLQMDSLTFGSSGKITLNLLNGFTGGKIIDITGATGLTEDILSKITIKGGEAFATIQEGDIYVYAGKANADFNFNENENENNSITEDVTANKITLNNSKEVAVTGEIKAFDSATITNSKAADGEEGKLNGGYDADGKELAAKITAGKNIVIQNDGHANVDLDAKNIVIANNSKNTLMGNIGTADTENIIIADGEATADGVTIDGNGTIDGAIKEATITAANIEIGGQEVSDTTLNGYTEIISDSSFTDVATSGIVSVGYKNENAADTTLTMAGETSIGTLYVGNEGRENDYKLSISGNDADVTLSNLYSRTDSVVEISDKATVNIGYWQSKGSVLIDNATVNHTGVNMYVYNNDSTSTAEIKLTNGATLNSDANYAIYLGNSEGGPAKGNAALILESGSTLNTKNLTLHADGVVEEVAGAAAKTSVSVTDSTLNVTGKMTNNGTVTVAGESTLKIATLAGENSIDLADGAIIKDSTVGGSAFVAGNVTFSGDNTFGMLYDYGTLTDYYGTTANMQWTVEKGASLTLTDKARYGLGYGDKVTINGNIAADGADAARATLTDDNAENDVKSSLFMHGLVAQESKGWDQTSYLTVNDAYVTIGSNNSFGNKPGNYGGNYFINFNNAVLDSSRITFYEALSKTEFKFVDSNVNTGTFMTRDKDSVFTLENTKMVSNTATNGTDEGNYNAGTLNITAGSELTYTAQLVNEGGVINVVDSTLVAKGGIDNRGSITVSGRSTLDIDNVTNTSDDATRIQIADGTTLVESNVGGYINLQGSLTAEGELTVGAIRAGNPVGEEVINSVISGDKITVSGNGRFQNGTYEINADMHFDQYVYLSYGGTFTITSDLTAGTTPQESDGAFWINGNVTLKDGASMVATNGGNIIFNNDTDTVLTVEAGAMVSVYDISDYKTAAVLNISGSVSASHVVSGIGEINVTDGTLSAEYFKNLDINSVNLTVTDKKLASLGKDSYVMVEQTVRNGHPYEFDLSGVGVTYNGNVYNVGDSITIGDVVYSVTAGDGNDIAIQALAKTVLLDSSIEGNGFNKFSQAGDFFEQHDSYAERIQGNPEVIMVNGENVLDTTASKYYFYSDSDLSIAGGTLDVSKAGRFYFMDTVAANGTAAADADFSNVATVTVEEGATLKGYINLGQAIDSDDVDDNGNVTRDGGAMNMVVKGTLDHKNLYVNTGSTLTVTETGKVTNYAGGGDNHVRAGAKVVVNGAGKDGDVQFTTNWWSIRGGEMEFNNTNAKTGTLRLNADNDNALVTGDTEAVLTVKNSTLDAYSIEVDNAESKFTATDSTVTTTLLENVGTMSISGSDVTASKVVNSGALNVAGSKLVAGSVSGSGSFTIGAGNTELQIGSLNQDVRANENSDEAITLTGNIGTANKFRVYGDATLDGFNVNAGYTGKTVSATGQVLVYGDTVISDSTMNLNYFQSTGSVLLESGSTIRTASINIYDMQEDSDFVVQGNLEACTFIVVNDYYNPGSGSEVIIDKGGVLTGLTQNGNGRFDIQIGNMTVYGTVNGNWSGGGGTAFIGNSGLDASLTVDGAEATFVNSDTQNLIVGTDGVLNVVNGATFGWAANIENKGAITVDASSSFTTGSIVNTGSINSANAGEMIVLSDMTVTGNITSGDLTLKAGVALSAGSITVTNLNLTLGSTLTLTSSAVSTVTGMISVFGEFSPENAEFVLVAQNWNSLGASDIYYDANNNGLIDGDTEKFAVGGNSGDYLFTVDGSGNLVMSKADPVADHVFIGDYTSDEVVTEVVGSKTYVVIGGVRYEVGKNAFATAAEAAAAVDTSKVTEITIGECDHISDIATLFANIEKITIPAGMSIEDTELAQFTKAHVEIINDGHLDADVKVAGKLTVSNTSFETLLGGADARIYELNNSGAVKDYDVVAQSMITVNNSGNGSLTDTTLTAAYGNVFINDDGTGSYTNVDVVADSLSLNNVKEFTLDADSSAFSVYMNGDAGKLTLDGAAVDTVYGSGFDAAGEVIFTGNSNLSDTTIEILDTVTLNGGDHEFGGDADNREYYFDNLVMGDAKLTWSWNDSDINEYHIGTTPFNNDSGMIKVTNTADATLTFDQGGEYSLGEFDVSDYNGNVAINSAATLTLAENTDYFANEADLTVDGSLNLNDENRTIAWDFDGTGSINVNGNHTFSAANADDTVGSLDGFSGTVTIADDKTLTLNDVNDTDALLSGNGDVVANADLTLNADGSLADFSGDIKAADSTVTLKGENIDTDSTNATFSGNGIVDVQASQTLEATAALDNFTGTVKITDDKVVTLNGVNDTDALLEGAGDVVANADLTLNTDGSLAEFSGDIKAAASTVTLKGANVDANSTEATFSGDGIIDVQASQTLEATAALDSFTGTVKITDDKVVTLNGANDTAALLEGAGDVVTNADLELDSDAALDAFTGSVTIADDKTMTLNGANDTAALLKGAGDVAANADLTLNAAGSLADFTGDIAANDSTVTLNGANTTSATFSSDGTIDVQADLVLKADAALDNLTGTLNNGGKSITLDGVNDTAAALTGSGVINANAAQTFQGDVSAYAGSYNAAAGADVTFTAASTLASAMELNGEGKFVIESQNAAITINSDSSNTALEFNNNCITLDSGKYSYLTGTDDSKLIINADITVAGTVQTDALVINADDSLTASKVVAEQTVVYIADTQDQGPAITVTDNSSDFGSIMVSSWSSAFETPFTIVDSVSGQLYDGTLVFVLTGTGIPGTSITVDGKAEKIGDKYVHVYTQDGDLLIGNYNSFSNVVYVNSDWSTVTGTVEKWTVSNTGTANDTDRIIDVDASKTLENAVNILKADADGKGQIFVVKGDTYIAPTAFMNDVNGLKELTITGESFYDLNNEQTQIGLGDVTIEGGVVALAQAGSGAITLENVSVSGSIYGGAMISGDAGSDYDTTSVKLDGGVYMSANVAGGSHVMDGNFVVGSTSVEIVNNSGERMAVMGRVLGGSIVAGPNASVYQENASVKVDASGSEITIRGDIYAAGANAYGGSLTVENTNVTFTGDAANLVFTGRVSGGAFGGDATITSSSLVFDDFTGMFKGLIQDFDTITVSGDTSLEFSRKQSMMSETDFVFDLSGRTSTDAMFTVNSYGWTYGDSISVNTGSSLAAGTYVLVDNWSSAYDVNFSINGVASQNLVSGSQSYTIGESSSGKLYLSVKDIAGNKVTTGAGVAILDNVAIGSGSGDALTVGLGSEEVIASGTTTINGNVNAPYAEANTFTVNDGMTTVNGEFNLSYGDDALVIKENAGMQITGALTLGSGVNNLEVGKNAELTVNGNANFGGGTAQNIITLGKGAVMNVDGGFSIGTTGSGSALVMDVDSILNNANGNGNKPIIAVDGVSALTTDAAGAKAIINALDWSASAVTNRQYTIDNVDAVLGTATQIAGVETVGDTSDDVWAALNKVDNQLVVSWGRTEMEAGAALDAFKADSTLTLGDALVAVDDSLLDGFDSDDNLTKKNNGTLA